MSECHVIDHLITAFVDNEISESQRTAVVAHLAECRVCRTEVEAESTARHVLRAHAAVARTMGVTPAWRPAAFRLGRPALVLPGPMVAGVLVAALVIGAVLLRPTAAQAVGVIGDSVCAATHPHAPGDAESRECVVNCVAHGAHFVLVSGQTVYRIENQEFPDLATFANVAVRVTGTIGSDAIRVSRVNAVRQAVPHDGDSRNRE
jgi:anti-sigma factor RsiW